MEPSVTLYVDPQGYNYARYVGVAATPGKVETLIHEQAQRKEQTRQEIVAAAQLCQQERAAAVTQGKLLFEQQKPAWATSAIVAELQENISDSQSDYFNSRTIKYLFLGWSKSTRDNFKEMRKAADTRAETEHLGVGKDIYTCRVVITNDVGGPPYYHAGDGSHWHTEEGSGTQFITEQEAKDFVASRPLLRPCGDSRINQTMYLDERSKEEWICASALVTICDYSQEVRRG